MTSNDNLFAYPKIRGGSVVHKKGSLAMEHKSIQERLMHVQRSQEKGRNLFKSTGNELKMHKKSIGINVDN